MTKQIILEYLSTHKDELQDKYNIERIGLFGPYARDQASTKSDIHIFVKMKPDLFNLMGLKQEIEEALSKKVDIIREHKNIKPLLLKMIEKDVSYV